MYLICGVKQNIPAGVEGNGSEGGAGLESGWTNLASESLDQYDSLASGRDGERGAVLEDGI